MAILDLFRAKARPVRDLLSDPSRFVIRQFATNTARPGITYKEVVEAERAMHHPVVFRCVNKIALAVQDTRWYFAQDPESKDKVPEAMIQKIQDVLDHPNDNMTASQLRYWLGLNKALYGRYALKIGASAFGGPNAIYPLSQKWFKTVSDKRGIITGYTYGINGEENLQTRRSVDPKFDGAFSKAFGYEYITPDQDGVINGKGFNMKGSNTPLNAIGGPTEIIRLLFQRAVETAGGQPNMKFIISGEKTLSSEEQDEIVDEIEDRKVDAEEAGNILFLANTSIKVDTLDNGLSDIHTKIPMDDMSRNIYANFGIPVALAGIGSSDAAKFAGNYESSRRSFYEDNIIPNYLGPIAEGLTECIGVPGGKVFFDHDSIAGLADARANKAKTLQGVTFLTDAEKRVLCGFPPGPERYANEKPIQPPSQEGTGQSQNAGA